MGSTPIRASIWYIRLYKIICADGGLREEQVTVDTAADKTRKAMAIVKAYKTFIRPDGGLRETQVIVDTVADKTRKAMAIVKAYKTFICADGGIW